LGLKNGSSQTLGLLDVTSAWEAFETINRVVVYSNIFSELRGTLWRLRMTLTAFSVDSEGLVVERLASESAICSDTEWKSLDTVVFRLLYALDAKIASAEFAESKKAVKPHPPQ